jgi:integrase
VLGDVADLDVRPLARGPQQVEGFVCGGLTSTSTAARSAFGDRPCLLIKQKGEPEHIEIGPPKSGKSRVIDVDTQTVAVLKAHRAARGTIALDFARDGAYVFGNLADAVRHPERFSRTFLARLRDAQRKLGEDAVPAIRLHDLRPTAATLMLQNGEHPKIVSERLGHASVSITMEAYSHAIPTLEREAAGRLANLVFGGGAS